MSSYPKTGKVGIQPYLAGMEFSFDFKSSHRGIVFFVMRPKKINGKGDLFSCSRASLSLDVKYNPDFGVTTTQFHVTAPYSV